MSSSIPKDRPLSFRWWDEQAQTQPDQFLAHDFPNQSRQRATQTAIELAQEFFGTIVEVGPGQGYDYENFFRPHVQRGRIAYVGIEGSEGLRAKLQERFPEVSWQHGFLAQLPVTQIADVMYARHVFEHQADLDTSMRSFLRCASHAAVICWYRPPSMHPQAELWQDIPHQTWYLPDVERAIAANGFIINFIETIGSDQVWTLRRST